MGYERDKFRVAKFRGGDGDFEIWSLRLKAVLEGKDLADVVYDRVKDPGTGQERHHGNYQQRVRKTKATIISYPSDKPLRVMQSACHPSKIHETLNNLYEAPTTEEKIAVMKSLVHTIYDDHKNMGEYLSEMESMFNNLAAMGSLIDSDMQADILLVSESSE